MRVVANFVHPDGKGGRWENQRLITSERELQAALEELCDFNLEYLFKYKLPDIYRCGIFYESEPPGQEDWLTYPILVQLGAGDCLPVSTLVLRDDFQLVPLASVMSGTRIMGHGRWTTVTAAAVTGEKPVLAMKLGNGTALRCSPEHRLFTARGAEIRAENVRPDQSLLTPNSTSLPFDGNRAMAGQGMGWTTVVSIQEEAPTLCGDITTEQGRFWLPESDLIVHNCEDLACARVSKLRQRGETKARPYLYHQGTLWHVMVKRGDGSIEDPSAVLGMYEALAGNVAGVSRQERARLAMVAGLHSQLGMFLYGK